MPEHIQRALQLLSSKDLSAAEALTEEFAAQVEELRQNKRPGLMLAEGDLARLYVLLGRLDDAILALRRATQVHTQNDPARREAQLKYDTNLAELLSHAGQPEEARRLHQKNLKQRRLQYGEGSLGYAIGEAPFAEMLSREGELPEAELRAKSAMEALLRNKASQAPYAVALHASIRAARYGDERPLLDPYRLFAGEPQCGGLIDACVERARRDPPAITRMVLDELRERLEDTGQHQELPAIRELQRMAAAASGSYARWASLLEEQREEATSPDQRLEVLLSLSVAYGEVSDLAAARRVLEEAGHIARDLGVASWVRVLRNKGRLLMRHHLEEAGLVLDEAILAAQGSESRAGALLARGLFLFHRGLEAGPLLREALGGLRGREARLAVDHLRVMEAGGACDCALEERVLRRARMRLPLGLLRGLWVEPLPRRELRAAFEYPPTPRERAVLTGCWVGELGAEKRA